MAQFTAANASTYATTPNFLASGSYEYKPDGRSCCTAGTQYSPEYCEDPNSPLGEDEYITACCMDGDNYIVHYANFASKPLNIGLSISDTVSIPNDAVPISVTYNITSVSLDHGTLYAEVTLSVSSIVQLSQTSTISIQLARVYADAGVFDFQIAEGIGAVVVNMQTRVNDDGTIDLKADIIGTSLLAAIESNFEQTIDEGLVKVLISTFGLCDEPSLEECAWLGTAPLCDGECPADGGWTLKREDRYGDGDLCVTGTKKTIKIAVAMVAAVLPVISPFAVPRTLTPRKHVSGLVRHRLAMANAHRAGPIGLRIAVAMEAAAGLVTKCIAVINQ
ncbi:hypothetical protein BDV25DRAFT_140747 [Aspergillus avenaceus]|uniref:Uncharacterized protein n=1 Tax=Aspergillus avenaceus TaxID=36643 RepID=A0A5N6TT55_ASPAV|nr:hypothetical protein BDV25DRAFT_140747 [Aspergillus avenaceus]